VNHFLKNIISIYKSINQFRLIGEDMTNTPAETDTTGNYKKNPGKK